MLVLVIGFFGRLLKINISFPPRLYSQVVSPIPQLDSPRAVTPR